MNVIFMSPHFPKLNTHFCRSLKNAGANVLGIADESYENLSQELKSSLTEYYKVNDLHHYDELIRACGYFTFQHGKIDRIESHNEYWLETDAKLRTDFNITGIKANEIEWMKLKSKMKQKYIEANVPVANGRIIHNKKDAADLIKETGYPVVAKPDNGVGAANTYKIRNENELDRFFDQKPNISYIMEEFINGDIYSFDGLTDRNGNMRFYTSHTYNSGVMEVLNDNLNLFYYSLINVPEMLIEYGKRIINVFNVKERFFHFEFFRLKNGSFVALEVNMRPPGGWTMDMFNYSADIDLYREWANVLVKGSSEPFFYERKYHVCYLGKKYNHNYIHSHDDIMRQCGDIIAHHSEMSGIFAPVMGYYGYLLRSTQLDRINKAIAYIHQE